MDKIKLLQNLIRIPSFSGKEEELAGFIKEYCLTNNLPVKIQKGNIIIHLNGKDQTKALVFNAHMDTVPYGNIKLWKYSPVGKKAGEVIDGKVYGLGASDNKAAITSMLILAKTVKYPPYDIWFTFVCNEETDGSGTFDFLQWFTESKYFKSYKSLAAIIGEPTNLENIEIGHRGNVFVRLTAEGITGHGAKAYSLEDLAVLKILKVLTLLVKVFKKWEKRYQDEILGSPSMNITNINSVGGSYNKIPDQCTATLDIRTTPKLHRKIKELLTITVGNGVNISYLKKIVSTGITSTKSPILKMCNKILPEVKTSISTGSTDLSQFTSFGIDAIVLGPGDKKVIHRENEFVQISDIDKVLGIYDQIISAFTKE